MTTESGDVAALARKLRHGREFDKARRLVHEALQGSVGREQADLLRLELATIRIAQTENPEDLADSVRAVAAQADAHVRAGRMAEAAHLVLLINEAVFHRELHGEVPRSPLAYDTANFLAPLRESLAFQALTAPTGSFADKVTQAPTRPKSLRGTLRSSLRKALQRVKRHRRQGRRILVISGGNLHFTAGIVADLEQQSDVTVKTLDLRRSGAAFARRGHVDMINDRLRQAAGYALPALSREAIEQLEWPDTVFVDWCDVAAQWAAIHVPKHVRLVIRVHSLEAISPQAHMIDWSRISDLIFVSGHIRDFFTQVVPRSKDVDRIHVVPNEMQLERFGLPKTKEADHTIAMVGWAQRVKDPLWALELLSLLRAHDRKWRLLLVGRDFAESQIASGYAYRGAFRERIVQDDVRDGVMELGHRTDLPKVFQDAGFVLSCSNREGGPVAITEGAASAAVPIVRNWPMAMPFGGAKRIFPAEWIVETPDEAAKRILAMSQQERESQGNAARQHVMKHFDWSVVAPRYREIFLGAE